MEVGLLESNSAKNLLLNAQARHKIFYNDFVVKAFYEAEEAHKGQVRATGDTYLQHCVETAVLLAMIGANSTVVAAGLLHHTLYDDTFMTYDYIFLSLGAGVADLVDEVSKVSKLIKLARDFNATGEIVEADRLQNMFLGMVDTKAVLITLADRLQNMMTLDALRLMKQQKIAKETLEIFIPLANRLGISTWKEQLENLCFKHFNRDQHGEISSKLVKSYEQSFKDESVSNHVLPGRCESLYSIYCKILK